MNATIPVSMFGWIPVVLGLFARLKPHRAAIAGFLLAWMFLPQYSFPLPGLPDYNKVSAACIGILLGVTIFDPSAIKKIRFSPVDLPVLGMCATPFFTSLANGLGAYDGLSSVLGKSMMWGMPWLIGRIYLADPEHLRDMALGIFIGGLVYVPFCLYEVAMSPRLHKIVYGFHPHLFQQSKRAGGGYRPVVFMQHGLMTAMWMTSASLCGIVMLAGGYFKKRFPKRQSLLVGALGALLFTAILSKSAGAIFLLVFGAGIFFAVRLLRQRWPLAVLVALPILYMATRGTGVWDAQSLIDASSKAASAERAGSLGFRIQNENILVVKALERPWLGWGGYRRSFVFDERGIAVSVPDGLWVLTFGQGGLVGLIALTLTVTMPVLLFLGRYPPSTWLQPEVATIAALPILLGLFMIDNLFNDMFNPAFLLVGGGLSGLCTAPKTDSFQPETDSTLMVESGVFKTRAL